MENVPVFDSQQLESIARLLADTGEGLKGSEIEHLLQECRMSDPTPSITKWKRLYNAFMDAQNQHQVGNHVVMFINRVMKPVRYTTDPQGFAKRRDHLNTILSFPGLYVGDDGKVRWSQKATNLDQALERAGRLHAALVSRGVHADVLTFCRAELLQQNYFHAVFEATRASPPRSAYYRASLATGPTLLKGRSAYRRMGALRGSPSTT